LQVVVQRPQRRALRRGRQGGARQAQRRVRLVHRAVGGHAGVVLGHAPAAEERRGAVVAGAGVDLHPAASAGWAAASAGAASAAPPKRLATYSSSMAVKRGTISSPCSVATSRPSW